MVDFSGVTRGHQKNLEELKSIADSYTDEADALVFTSHTHDSEKNPLTYEQKIKYLRKIAPKGVKVIDSPATNLPKIFKALAASGYTDAVFVIRGRSSK